MAEYAFAEAGMHEDWRFEFQAADIETWDEDDVVTLSMTPDYAAWDDYGWRTRSPVPGSSAAPWLQTASGDGTGQVELGDDGLVIVVVPWSSMNRMGPGGVRVALRLDRGDGSRKTLLFGRLPLIDTGG